MLLTLTDVSSRASSASSAEALAPMSVGVEYSVSSCHCPQESVAKHTNGDTTLLDHGAVGLIDDVVDQGEIVGVRDHLVSGDNVRVDKHLGGIGR